MIFATGGTAPVIAAKAATTTIPIVFTIPEDPVQLELAASLSRPEGFSRGLISLWENWCRSGCRFYTNWYPQ